MRLNQIADNAGARKARKIVGRGHSSGHGKTSSRGGKGQTARSGGKVRIGFEGGQNPLYRRVPIRGFNNYNFQTRYATINVGELEGFVRAGRLNAKEKITLASLQEAGIVKQALSGLKILADGPIKAALNIEAAAASAQAIEKVKKAGGTLTVLPAKVAPQPTKPKLVRLGKAPVAKPAKGAKELVNKTAAQRPAKVKAVKADVTNKVPAKGAGAPKKPAAKK